MKKHSNPIDRITRPLTFGVVGIVLATIQPTHAGHGNIRKKSKDRICSICRKTANLARRAALLEAKSDFFIALGKANNIEDRGDRAEAVAEARGELRESYFLIREQHKARLDICRDLGECRYDPDIDPSNFLSVEEIVANPNPLLPLIPGRIFTYEAETEDGLETIVLTITYDTREVAGVPCIVVRDTVTVEDELVEDTFDWYAQDKDGNVWYFGELSMSFEDGELESLEGSWETGKDDAKPGIVMLADPRVGDVYRQEYLLGEAEDMGRVLGLDETVELEIGTFEGCLKTADYLPIEPDALEHKFYAPNVGLVYEVDPDSGETLELVKMEEFDEPEEE